jgi:uncharacterized 2Fe-2S/4Fe-4S cluster protein (DUF4445 family)
VDFRITFLPERRSWQGAAPVPLSLAASACDIVIEQPCGARATCGRCRVRFGSGAPSPDEADARVLGDDAVREQWRLGCRVVLAADAVIEVPWQARVVAHKSFGGDDLFAAGFDAVAEDGWGVALDVGSTTLAAAVVALGDGAVHGTAAVLNPQVAFGADVMSRVAFARAHPSGLQELRRALLAGANEVLARASAAAGVDVGDITQLAAVGNPTMLHALRGLPLDGLGVAPYQGTSYDAWEGDACALGIPLAAASALLLPAVRAHVGADTVAAILATGLDRTSKPRLLLDVGTNTELVLARPEGILCTSAAAGPAFEGASIRCGMRAVAGAIEQVRIAGDGTLQLHTIGDEPALGICGSGLVDAVAELLRTGIIEASGRMRDAAELPRGPLAVHLAAYMVEHSGERAVRLADGAHGPVVLTARDVREFQLVKGSIASAVSLLLTEAGIGVADLEEVLLAGAFGSYVRLSSALALGLLPPVPPERVRFVGNAAGAGARLVLVDRRARERAVRVARETRFVELAGHPDYQESFVAMLPFPKPEATS